MSLLLGKKKAEDKNNFKRCVAASPVEHKFEWHESGEEEPAPKRMGKAAGDLAPRLAKVSFARETCEHVYRRVKIYRDARPVDPLRYECAGCGIDLPLCRFAGCQRAIAKVMPHEVVPRQTSEQWMRAAEVLCTKHALEKMHVESGLGILKQHKLESITRPAKLELEVVTCDVGADWED